MYEVAKADKITKFNNSSTKITEPLRLFQKQREETPDGGFYQKVDESFCKNSKKITSLILPPARFINKHQTSHNVLLGSNSPILSQN